MTIASERLHVSARAARKRVPLAVVLDRESVFSWLMMALPLAFLAALVGYPFFYGILLSMQDRPVAHTGTFVGLKNFVASAHDPIFWRAAINTFVYTFVATVLKMVGGLGLALAMNQHFRMKNLVRALLLLPFIVPTVLSTVAWMWMLDPAFSVVNPLVKPISLIVTLFSVILTFADFQLVYVLTHGGPQNATQLFATYAFDIGMGAGQLGLGASVALMMLPALALLIMALTLYMRRTG